MFDIVTVMRKYFQKNLKTILLVVILLVLLPFTIPLAQQAWKYLTGASYVPANIVVDVSQTNGRVKRVWDGVAQGFEKLPDASFRLNGVTSIVKPTGVRYVRIDHVFDGFDVVSRGGDGKLAYNWTKLDAIVGDIASMGAKPFISLSYMPSAISKSDILDFPTNWGEWGQVVAATVGHYSRDYKGGIDGVVYEVWNEPDLFGGWKMGGSKSYVTLYATAANAANNVRGAKSFKIGGPATTGFYPAWVTGFYDKLDENVRIDFFSWHRYDTKIAKFLDDANTASNMMSTRISRPQDLYITEWGINPERGAMYDGRWAAAHYLAVNRALMDTNIDLAFAFEIMDGAPAEKGQFHGGWGMLTNPKYGAVAKKPRFKAWEMLAPINGDRLVLSGEGNYVTGIATRDTNETIRILLVNYDESGKHDEVVPYSMIGMLDGVYSINETYLSGRVVNTEVTVVGGSYTRDILLNDSDAVLLTLARK